MAWMGKMRLGHLGHESVTGLTFASQGDVMSYLMPSQILKLLLNIYFSFSNEKKLMRRLNPCLDQ